MDGDNDGYVSCGGETCSGGRVTKRTRRPRGDVALGRAVLANAAIPDERRIDERSTGGHAVGESIVALRARVKPA